MPKEKSVLSNLKSPYPRQRVFGLFLISVGITMALSTMFGNSEYPNVVIFIIGYIISNVCIMFNKKVRKKFSIGESTPLQKKASNLSLIFLAIVVPIIGMSLSSTGNYRLIWLLILLAVGVHFIPFSLIHGKLSLLLAGLLIINSAVGIYLSNVPFFTFGLIDAFIKFFIGILLFKLSPKA